MKNIIFLWFLIFFTNCESQNIQYKKHKTDWEKEKLKGKNINVLNIPEFFKQLKEKVDNYYTEKVDG
nr:hypothetical protein [uncultured Capnocytophaga sp.]